MLLLSASQIQLWTECQRKWGFRYLARLEVPPHPGAVLGKEVHEKQLGPYLTRGQSFDFTRPSGEIANALRTLLPEPGTKGLVVERHFEIPSPSFQWGYQGYLDLYAPDSACVPGLAGGRPLVGDFKTTSNLDFAKTSEMLQTDFQAQLYSVAMMVEEGVDELDLVWFYTRTRRPHKAFRVHLHVTAPHVEQQFERIEGIAAEVAAARQAAPPVDELRPNARMCDQYGGCPFRFKCNLSPTVHAAAVNEEAKMNNDFLAKLRKNVAPETMLPPAPEPASVAVAINPPESALPPAPPVNVPEPEAPKAKRGRPAKAEAEAERLPVEALSKPIDVDGAKSTIKELAAVMRAVGVKKVEIAGGQVYLIELA